MDNKLNIIIDVREESLYNDIFDRDLDIYKDKIEITKKTLDICVNLYFILFYKIYKK